MTLCPLVWSLLMCTSPLGLHQLGREKLLCSPVNPLSSESWRKYEMCWLPSQSSKLNAAHLLSCSALKNSSENITSGGQINNYISTAVNVRSFKRFAWCSPSEERKHLRMKIISSRIIGKSIKNRASCLIHIGYFGQAETQR